MTHDPRRTRGPPRLIPLKWGWTFDPCVGHAVGGWFAYGDPKERSVDPAPRGLQELIRLAKHASLAEQLQVLEKSSTAPLNAVISGPHIYDDSDPDHFDLVVQYCRIPADQYRRSVRHLDSALRQFLPPL